MVGAFRRDSAQVNENRQKGGFWFDISKLLNHYDVVDKDPILVIIRLHV